MASGTGEDYPEIHEHIVPARDLLRSARTAADGNDAAVVRRNAGQVPDVDSVAQDRTG